MAKLQVGDIVFMNDKYYEGEEHKNEVFTIKGITKIGRTSVAWLEGYKGCYALDGLTRVKKTKRRQK